MEQQKLKLDSWIKIVKKAVVVNAKIGFQYVLFIQEMDNTSMIINLIILRLTFKVPPQKIFE